MAVKFEEYEANVCEAYVCAIEYGDTSNLIDEEAGKVEAWLEKIKSEMQAKWISFDWNGEKDFTRCDISGLMADCIPAKIYGRKEA